MGKKEMKKALLCTFLALCLVCSACGTGQQEVAEQGSAEEPAQVEQEAQQVEQELPQEAALEEYISELHLLASPTREYGEETGYILLEGDMVARVLYPEGEIAALNRAIEDWVAQTVAYYQEESAGLSQEGNSAELTVEYDSYMVNDRIVSVKLSGFYEGPNLAHPVDVLATFHADGQSGALLTLEEVLLPGGADLLRSRVMADAAIGEEKVDEGLLDRWTLSNDGLEILLERGTYLPMSAGSVTLTYAYEEIGDIFSFRKDLNAPDASQEEPSASAEGSSGSQELSVIDPAKPMVALTFDDGPSKHTARLLDTFAAHGGKGTFFVVGNLIDSRADVVLRMAQEGHEVAGHSWNHNQLTKLSAEELTNQLMSTRAKIYDVTGIDSTSVRPPYGAYNAQVKSVCQTLGIYMVNWSVDTLDWKHRDVDQIYDTIMAEVKDGAIILCHDLHGTTVDAMERVIPDLIAEGYQLVTTSELLAYGGKEISAGSVYHKAAPRAAT